MIVFEKVTKVYADGTVALDEATIQISPKEFISIVGHSGAGKTTLIKMLLAEDKPTDAVDKPVDKPADTNEDIFDEADYIKNNFGAESADIIKQQLAELKELKEKPQSAADIKFADEQSKRHDGQSFFFAAGLQFF